MSVLSAVPDSVLYTREYFLQDDICRLCWEKNARRDIFTKPSENESKIGNYLLHMIKDCLEINLSAEDYESHPTKVCESCFGKVESFFDFKTFCQESNRKLHEIFSNSGHEPTADLKKSATHVKSEEVEDFPAPDLYKDDSLDNFLDCLETPEADLASVLADSETKKKSKPRNYKRKRGSTYCNICCSIFKNSEALLEHNSVHGIEENGEYKCFGCVKKFKTRAARRSHEMHFCKGLEDGYKCNICNRFLPKRRMYETHLRDHRVNKVVDLPEDIFKCGKCLKKFKTKEDLRIHIKTHETGTVYVCESCGRVFTRLDYLQKHMTTHTGVKRHECVHCGFRTSQKSSLTVHVRKHTGERPFSCDVCPQRCVSSSNLRAHRRRHLRLAHHQCTLCPKKFGYKSSLEEHIASAHERSEPHPCPHCGASYARKRGLRRHIQAKHGSEPKQTIEKDSNQEVLNAEASLKNKDSVFQNQNLNKIDQGDSFSEKPNEGAYYVDNLAEKVPATDSCDQDFYKNKCENEKFCSDKQSSCVINMKEGSKFVLKNEYQVFIVPQE